MQYDSKRILPVVPFDKIQTIRLVQALAETNYEICLPPEHAPKFDLLRSVFGMKFSTDTGRSHALDGITIVHSQPLTRIGSISRPLIFPHALVEQCKKLWPANRPYRYSFAGLLTPRRKEAVEKWMENNLASGKKITLKTGSVLLEKIKKKLFNASSSHLQTIGELTVCRSTRGRTFPVKSWDAAYYDLLAKSKYVLCPNGDFIWTYRFFESILCGAIPIVEDDCPEYAGFKYLKMRDKVTDLPRSPDVVEYNYQLCVERLTVPVTEIEKEIDALIQARHAGAALAMK